MSNIDASTATSTTPLDYTPTEGAGAVCLPPQGNSVEQSEAQTAPPATQSAADGARECSTPTLEGYAQHREDVAQVLKEDPRYQEAEAKLKLAGQLKKDFAAVEGFTIVSGDNLLNYGDVHAVANNPAASKAVRDAAKRLLENWSEMGGGTLLKGSQVQQHAVAMKKERDAIEAEVSAALRGVAPELPIVPAVTVEAGGDGVENSGGSVQETKEVKTNPADDVPKPAPSTKPGLDGALENLGNGLDHVMAKIDAVANSDMEPGAKQAALTKLQFEQQALANMMNQLSTMMSNMVKLWSDIAMNAVRNIR